MKKNVLTSVIVFIFLSLTFSLKAQTILTIGDIAFTGYNSDEDDDFSFIILRTGGIASGTVINFTDYGWNAGACGTNGWGSTVETEITWTTNSPLPYGTQIVITGLTASQGIGTGTVTGTALSLSAGGDQIFAYQGPRTGAYTLIAGIHMNSEPPNITNATNWDSQASITTGTQSNRPPCLTNGTYALYIENPVNLEVDNARLLSTVTLTGTRATDLALINNAANWEINDITAFTLPSVLTLLPVHFNEVKAFERNMNIQIDWKMDIQDNVVKYIVERSADGETFTELSTIAVTASGSYSWTDQQPSGQVSYYRIKAIELTGNVKYTRVMKINLTGISSGIKIYPTILTNHQFNLEMNNLPQGNYTFHVYNTTGQVIMNKVLLHTGGTSTQTLLLPANVNKGMYKIRLGNLDKAYYSSIIVE